MIATQPATRTVPRTKIIVGLSGGVDSSVSALLLKRQGYAVEGLFMKNWEEDDTENYCGAAKDAEDARRVCDDLGILLNTVNLSADYWENVFTHFLNEYRGGHTPNPDILCNREIKFKAFLTHAQSLGADMIAMGHYARVSRQDGHLYLRKGFDDNKDQSYFLHALDQEQLGRSLFPIGEFRKAAVRKLAAEAGLVTHNKKDSTGICFIGERRFKPFLMRFLPVEPGDIQTPGGKIVGQHDGLMYYTLGQRKGLGIGGRREGNGEPWYVVAKDLKNNVLIVAQGHDHPLLYRQHLVASALHWIVNAPSELPFRCKAKTRYRQPDQDCTITSLDNAQCHVKFDRPQRAMTPGQSVVFYQGDVCLGGGPIAKTAT
ncbi:MAG: tRNA 2-thiouridine(34) synthase MnmA [Gammaproteobacteria bacterium]|nr:tRNA 2-thiouridine(34) synthase MnmA [Gammaproteobacteria bacterium]MCI0591511.1 tRNA 2-thiouridine(34) synthase MnmA [Gammaproteobacteria bacterium]